MIITIKLISQFSTVNPKTMLTKGQKNYLSKLDPKRASMPVSIKPFDPYTQIVAEKAIKKNQKANIGDGHKIYGRISSWNFWPK